MTITGRSLPTYPPNDHYDGSNAFQPGGWVIRSAVADTGSTLSMMTLTLMALGVAARRFKRAAA
jgi:hypothetical protein